MSGELTPSAIGQAAPGIKITSRAFGRDRRLPITNRYRDTPTPR